MSQSSGQLIKSADGSAGKSGGGMMLAAHGSTRIGRADPMKEQRGITLFQQQGCSLEAAQRCSKQKTFGTPLAMASSPAFHWAAKNPMANWGIFSPP
jgi:hypothetical protein